MTTPANVREAIEGVLWRIFGERANYSPSDATMCEFSTEIAAAVAEQTAGTTTEVVYEVVHVGQTRSTVGFRATIAGAKAAAEVDHAEVVRSLDALPDEERADYSACARTLTWEFKQFYFKAGGRTIPNGLPRHGADTGDGSSYQIFEREVGA